MISPGAPELDTPRVVKPMLRAPAPDAHKYSRGMVVVVGGDMPGASLLAAEAAMKLAGYVALVGGGGGGPHALVRKNWGDVASDQRVGVLLIGPGLGFSAESRGALTAALASDHALILDGDALTILAETQAQDFRGRTRPVILTPHAGEFVRLFPSFSGDKEQQAREAAEAAGATLIFKGAQTVIASPGGDIAISSGASPWLASAGTGDVLAGIVAGLMSNGLPPMKAACAAVWLHGECAQLAGPALIADDLVHSLPRAIAQCL
jgi:ADP-dependent NAD(P)H-hydrate dehydratase / NAD(P)H-hydrate epimerase